MVKVEVDDVFVLPTCHQVNDFTFAVIIEDDGVFISDLINGKALY